MVRLTNLTNDGYILKGKECYREYNHVASLNLYLRSLMQWRIYGGLRGFNPPPPLGLPSENVMCIEKRLVDDALHRHWVEPPLGKKLNPPLIPIAIAFKFQE